MKRKAPCKINLALDILGRRPDGYHEMDMIMQTVSPVGLCECPPGSGGICHSHRRGSDPGGEEEPGAAGIGGLFCPCGP
mgnify:CR=1 FL=1